MVTLTSIRPMVTFIGGGSDSSVRWVFGDRFIAGLIGGPILAAGVM